MSDITVEDIKKMQKALDDAALPLPRFFLIDGVWYKTNQQGSTVTGYFDEDGQWVDVDWPEERMDIIGQNGNDGLIYDEDEGC